MIKIIQSTIRRLNSVSLAAAVVITYVKGERVAYKFPPEYDHGKGTWYLGTISRVASGKVSVIFDDDMKKTFELKDKALHKINLKRKVKREYNDAQMKPLLLVPEKEKTAKSKATVPVKVKAPTKVAKR